MIGSDWPVCTLAASYSGVIEVVADYLKSFPTETREAVMGGNAQRFWRLKPQVG
jgi:L-fuconolactonase